MNILSVLLKVLLLIGLFLLQIVFFVLKLVPLAFFFKIIQKLLIGGDQIVQMILSNNISIFAIIIIIFSIGYAIFIGLIHLTININIFNNLLAEINQEGGAETSSGNELKKFKLNFKIVNDFRKAFIHYVSVHFFKKEGENESRSNSEILRDKEMIKKSFVLSFFLFQGGVIKISEYFSEMKGGLKKFINVSIIVLISLVLVYVINYKEDYVTKTGEVVSISNGYEFIKDRLNVFSSLNGFVNTASDNLNETFTFQDVRIQYIGKVYRNISLMRWLAGVEFLEQKNTFNEIKATNTDVENKSLEEINAESSQNNKSLLNNSNIVKFLNRNGYKFSLGDLPDNGIYFDEYLKNFYGHNISNKKLSEGISYCLKGFQKDKGIMENYFIPENYWNNRLFNQYIEGKIKVSQKTKSVFSDLDIKKNGNNYYISKGIIKKLSKKYDLEVPGENNISSNKAIGLFFIVGEQGGYYKIDNTLFNYFKNEYENNIVKTNEDNINNPYMLYNYNKNIVNFCYGYGLYKTYSLNKFGITSKKKGVDGSTVGLNIKNYSNLLNGMLNQYGKSIKGDFSDVKKREMQMYLLLNTEYYLRDGFESTEIEKRGGNIFKKYFYSIGNGNYDFLIGRMLSTENDNPLQLLETLKPVVRQTDKNILSNKEAMNLLGNYIGVDSSISNFLNKETQYLRTKYNIEPDSRIFNDNNKLLIKKYILNGYKGEGIGINNTSSNNLLSDPEIRLFLNRYMSETDQETEEVNNNTKISKTNNIMFFGKPLWLDDGDVSGMYKKVGVMLGIIPLFETNIGFFNFFLFLFYSIILLIILFLELWFSGILQVIFNYYKRKREGKSDESYSFQSELINFLVRFVSFIFLMKLYFIFTIL